MTQKTRPTIFGRPSVKAAPAPPAPQRGGLLPRRVSVPLGLQIFVENCGPMNGSLAGIEATGEYS
jgi:hypothetical protein